MFAVGQADGRADLSVRKVLEALEMIFCFRSFSGTLESARQRKLGRSVVGIDLQCLFKTGDGLVGVLQILVTDANEVIRVRIVGIVLDCLLKAVERWFQFIIGMLGQAEVVPGLGIGGVEVDGPLQGFLGVVQLLQRHQGDALIDGCLRQFRVIPEGLSKGGRCTISKLLAHLRDATIIEPRRLGTGGRLRCAGGCQGRNQGKGRGPGDSHQNLSHRI